MEATPTLLDLQSLDLTIDRLRARERVLHAGDEVAAVRREADAAEGALGELRLAIDAMDRDADKLEHGSIRSRASRRDERRAPVRRGGGERRSSRRSGTHREPGKRRSTEDEPCP